MGGVGSGRIKSIERDLIEQCDSIDINIIYRWGEIFFPIYAFIDYIDDKKFLFIDYKINWMRPSFNFIDKFELAYTFPGFGGKRYWIICKCGKWVRKLYRPDSKSFFQCRICHNLKYSSQESKIYDSWLKKVSKFNGMSPKKYEKIRLAGMGL